MATSIKAYPRLKAAEELLRKGLRDQASFAVIEHLRENRDEPRGLALLGEIALESGAFVQAESFLRRAMLLGASSPDVRRNLAMSLLRQDRLSEALNAFTELQPLLDDPSLLEIRASILGRL